MDTVFQGGVRFLSRAAPLDCGLARGFSKVVIHVKGDMLVCMVSAVKLIP